MNIGINARHLIEHKLEGIGWYSFEILNRIVQLRPDDHFYFYYDRKTKPLVVGRNITNVIVYPSARSPHLFRFWFNVRLPRLFKKNKIDLFFSPDGFISLATSVPQIAVIHDLNFEHYPHDVPKHILKYYKKYMPLFAKRAKKIVTVSNFSKMDICGTYKVDQSKVSVIYNGGNSVYKPLEEKYKKQFKSEQNQERPYFVYVGSLHKRKNIQRMFEAFNDFNKGGKFDLIVIGEPMWGKEFQRTQISPYIKIIGRKSGLDLSKWVASSEALIYVSYFEGFGLPVLEGMMAGVPVVTSDITSIPEVGGEAVVYVDPFNVKSISKGISIAVEKHEVYAKLGPIQAVKFNWDKAADELNHIFNHNMLEKN